MTIIDPGDHDQVALAERDVAINELKEELAMLRAHGCTRVILDIAFAEQLVELASGVLQLTSMTTPIGGGRTHG